MRGNSIQVKGNAHAAHGSVPKIVRDVPVSTVLGLGVVSLPRR